MLEVRNIDVWGLEHAIRGMRNPMNSWSKSDSRMRCGTGKLSGNYYVVGEKDLELMHKLYKAGTEHRKYLRQIFVSLDILAPLYFWKEFDTYKIGTVSNSCSTMHTLADHEFELKDFSYEHLLLDDVFDNICVLESVITVLNDFRNIYLISDKKNKKAWWQMIQLLPSSYNQLRTITMNYENVVSIIHQRENHKLDEWRVLVDELKSNLPYIKEIMYG